MINKYPLWKYLLILVMIMTASLYALPNLFGEDPAVQITSEQGDALGVDEQDQVINALNTAQIPYKSVSTEDRNINVRFPSIESQLEARDLLKEKMGRGYITALNLAPATPGWLAAMNALPMYLGLDLRGGVHLLMEVDMESAITKAEERYVSEFRSQLRGEKIRYLTINRVTDEETSGVEIKFRDQVERDKGVALIEEEQSDLQIRVYEEEGSYYARATISEVEQREIRNLAIQQNITTLRKRVNELGVAEPIIQRQGKERIVVQLPGVQNPTQIKELLGATATLEYRLVDTQGDIAAATNGRVPPGSKLYYERNGNPILLKKHVMLTGDYIIDASSGLDQDSGSPAVFVTLDGKGASIFSRETRDNINKPMAVVFLEVKSEYRKIDGKEVKVKKLVEEVISVAVIRDQLSKRFQTSGLDSPKEARDLALLLRAGALAAPIEIVEERTVGPSLGQDNIDQGFRSVAIGFVLVLAFMAFWYRGFGLVANMALALNLVFIVAVLSMLQATLTMPGIAGIVLTVGMAVDANVLIFERIREEITSGNSPQNSIHMGYEKAFSTIADANITTLIAAMVLFGFGTGPIKGFAITLSIGIITSMFTAIMGTRAVVNLIYGGRKVEKLSI
jgi:preprotein translocase subunit SecD